MLCNMKNEYQQVTYIHDMIPRICTYLYLYALVSRDELPTLTYSYITRAHHDENEAFALLINNPYS